MIGLSAMIALGGCLNLQLGGGTTSKPQAATTGQQLMDLQRAKAAGIITEEQYDAQKAKLLND